MACNPLSKLARECGKNTVAGMNDDVYLVAFDSLAPISGSTEVYTTSAGGLISAIGFQSGSTKFVKYSATKNQNTISETYAMAETGAYDITKTLTFTLGNLGSLVAKTAVENLIANPVAVLTKLKNGSWVAFGLNGSVLNFV
jgi:hypothetical protein